MTSACKKGASLRHPAADSSSALKIIRSGRTVTVCPFFKQAHRALQGAIYEQ